MKKIIALGIALLLFTPLFAGASFDKNLYYGLQKDSQVKELQEFLIAHDDLTGNATGNFFSLTLKGVKKFQSENGLPITGYFGPKSMVVANDILVKDLADSNTEATPDNNPVPTPPATTNDVVSKLQEQIALLQKQLDATNTQSTFQQNTLNQIQQDTQQIAQNTVPASQPVPSPTSVTPLVPVFQPNVTLGSSDFLWFTVAPELDWQPNSNCGLKVTDQNGNIIRNTWTWGLNGRQTIENGAPNPQGQPIKLDTTNNIYSYQLVCKKTGYQDFNQSGTFPAPSN